MNNRALLPLLLNAILLAFTPAALADQDKDESGKGRYRGQERKEEFWDGNCKVERKWKKNGDYKEERKCRGGGVAAYVQSPPPVVTYPPWIVVQQGAPAYVQEHRPAVPAFGVTQCNSQRVGQVLGGVLGGVLGNQIGKGSGRIVATIGGAVAGVLIGGEVGKRLDANDQACVGQVLEFAPAGQRVQWSSHGTQYVVVPGVASRSAASYCRPYTVHVQTPSGWKRSQERACRRPDGVWQTA